MYIKHVSDLDYSFNPATGEYDVPAVEWSTYMGCFWERFESEEARSEALDKNQAYNDQPEVAAYIKEQEEAEDKWRAEAYTSELFEWAMEQGRTIALSDAIRFAEYCNAVMKREITKLVCLHNKLIMKARVAPAPATATIGDFSDF
jgi:hypothetical protein